MGSNQYQQKVGAQNFAEAPQGESRDIAAKAVAWNRETYRQAKAVVDSGNDEAIEQNNAVKGYGFINSDDVDYYFHVTEYNSKNKPEVNADVTFESSSHHDQPRAVRVDPIELIADDDMEIYGG